MTYDTKRQRDQRVIDPLTVFPFDGGFASNAIYFGGRSPLADKAQQILFNPDVGRLGDRLHIWAAR